MKNPTEEAYAELRSAYDFFNAELFAGRLPACLITWGSGRILTEIYGLAL